MCRNKYIYANMHTHTYTHIHTYIPTYTHTYINKYIHTYIHTYIGYLGSNLGKCFVFGNVMLSSDYAALTVLEIDTTWPQNVSVSALTTENRAWL